MSPDHRTTPADPSRSSNPDPTPTLALIVNSGGGSADSERIAAVRTALDAAGLTYSVYERDGDPSVAAERRRDLLRIAVRIARDRIGRERDLIHRTGHRVTLSATSATTLLVHDGEVGPVGLPLAVEIRPGALPVLF